MAQPPLELQNAINSSSQKYNVPTDVLTRVWQVESGSSYPNAFVNSSGYGGLFGTTLWNAPTQVQSDYAASILQTGFSKYGNWADALSYYRTGKPGQGYPAGNSGGTVNMTTGSSQPPASQPSASSGGIFDLSGITNAISGIPAALLTDAKTIGIGLGFGLLAIILIIGGILVIVAPAAKSVVGAVKP
jgi:hypothetical protein